MSDSTRPQTPQEPLAAALRALLEPIVAAAVRDALAANENAPPKRALLTVEQLCEAIQVSRSTLHALRSRGLPTILLGDSPRFALADVIAWLKTQRNEGDALSRDGAAARGRAA